LKAKANGVYGKVMSAYNHKITLLLRVAVFAYAVKEAIPATKEFSEYCHTMAVQQSGPSIMFQARLNTGEQIIVDDYREAYWWLRDNTPEDARILAWWDYGYQITGIGNRTTLADGNTWNHEHIATLGRILSGNQKEAHRIARHVADYVLVWAGGGGDDLAKSPHMARIGNSVYHDICPGDPTCSQFGFYAGGKPTKMMEQCLLYKMVRHGQQGVIVDPKKFRHVFDSKFGKVRIFKIVRVSQKSKKWIADPANRICDAPGSWYCVGQYPPALKELIDSRKAFRQLEDFNAAKDKDADEYTKKYMDRMSGKGGKGGEGGAKQKKQKPPQFVKKLVGCYEGEDSFPEAKTYGGGESGASISQAAEFAWSENKKYVAIARTHTDGHSFAFDTLPTGESLSTTSDGCARPCKDSDKLACGCADGGCGDMKPTKEGDNVRRWVVYEVGPNMINDEPKEAKKAKSKKKKGKKKKKSKPEL